MVTCYWIITRGRELTIGTTSPPTAVAGRGSASSSPSASGKARILLSSTSGCWDSADPHLLHKRWPEMQGAGWRHLEDGRLSLRLPLPAGFLSAVCFHLILAVVASSSATTACSIKGAEMKAKMVKRQEFIWRKGRDRT